jgi:O-antigen/teichoic acid export membrane protein
VSDYQTHRAHRIRNIRLSGVIGVAGRLVAMLTMFVSYPMTLHYLGSERFGLWMIVSSFNMAISFADLGLGNGLLTVVAESSGRDDYAAIRQAISSAYLIVSLIAALIMISLGLSAFHSFWPDALSIHEPGTIAQLPYALFAFAACFTINIPLSLATKIQSGMQEGYIAALWQAAGSILSLLLIVGAVLVHADVATLILAFMGGGIIANMFNSILLYMRRPEIRPRLNSVSPMMVKTLLRTGMAFFFLQLVISLSFGYDSVVIARSLGAVSVVQWAVPERLFSVIGILSAFALQPLWPAYREAIGRGDMDWVRLAFRNSLLLTVGGATLLAVILTLVAPFVIPLWVGHAIHPSLWVVASFGLWRIIDATYNCLTTFLNGLGRLRLQMWVTSIVSAVMLSLKIILVSMIGVAGVPLGAAAAVGLIGLPALLVALRNSFAPAITSEQN